MGLFRKLQPPTIQTADVAPPTPPIAAAAPVGPSPLAIAPPAGTITAPPIVVATAAVAPSSAPVAAPSGAAAEPPAPAPAQTPSQPSPASALTQGVRAVAEQLKALGKDMAADRQTILQFTEKVQGLEERMKSLHNLSELLSMRYNPFLGDAEDSAFEGRLPRLDELAAAPADRAQGGGSPRATSRTFDATTTDAPVRHVVPESGPAHAVGEPAFDDPLPPDPRAAAPTPHEDPSSGIAPTAPMGAPAAKPARRPSMHEARPGPAEPRAANGNGHHAHPRAAVPRAQGIAAGADPAWGAWPTPAPMLASMPHHGPRMAFLVLSWFERLLESVNPASLPAFVDYYHGIGWIPDDAHTWMLRMAEGVAPRRSDASPQSFLPSDPRKLVQLHRSNLRFLDYLFNGHLGDDEPSQMEKAARVVLGRR